MKKLLLSASVLLLIGAGCASAPPAAAPSATEPAQPTADTGAPTQPAKPGTPVGKPTNIAVPNPGAISPENSEDRVVVFNTEGKFDPPSIAVHIGRKVTWINQSKQPLWVASNPHPFHTDCPGFDSKAVIPPGDSWSYTFPKAEVCNYHNHLQSIVGGVVTVTPVGK